MNPYLADISIAIALVGLLILSLEIGYQIGGRVKRDRDGASVGQIGAIQGAVLGLLGLLLAFTFTAAAGRFLERQDLITTEANAIGTSTLRADLVSPPHRAELRAALKEYTQFRLTVSDRLRYGAQQADLAAIDRQLARLWSAAMAGVNDRPQTMLSVLAPVNEVIDLHTTRLAASRKQLPKLVTAVLLASSVLAMAVMGYGSGVGGHRRAPMTISLAVIVGTLLWITYDLDHPRAGLLQLNDAPLRALTFDEPQP